MFQASAVAPMDALSSAPWQTVAAIVVDIQQAVDEPDGG
jgi:hypothetical protein